MKLDPVRPVFLDLAASVWFLTLLGPQLRPIPSEASRLRRGHEPSTVSACKSVNHAGKAIPYIEVTFPAEPLMGRIHPRCAPSRPSSHGLHALAIPLPQSSIAYVANDSRRFLCPRTFPILSKYAFSRTSAPPESFIDGRNCLHCKG